MMRILAVAALLVGVGALETGRVNSMLREFEELKKMAKEKRGHNEALSKLMSRLKVLTEEIVAEILDRRDQDEHNIELHKSFIDDCQDMHTQELGDAADAVKATKSLHNIHIECRKNLTVHNGHCDDCRNWCGVVCERNRTKCEKWYEYRDSMAHNRGYSDTVSCMFPNFPIKAEDAVRSCTKWLEEYAHNVREYSKGHIETCKRLKEDCLNATKWCEDDTDSCNQRCKTRDEVKAECDIKQEDAEGSACKDRVDSRAGCSRYNTCYANAYKNFWKFQNEVWLAQEGDKTKAENDADFYGRRQEYRSMVTIQCWIVQMQKFYATKDPADEALAYSDFCYEKHWDTTGAKINRNQNETHDLTHDCVVAPTPLCCPGALTPNTEKNKSTELYQGWDTAATKSCPVGQPLTLGTNGELNNACKPKCMKAQKPCEPTAMPVYEKLYEEPDVKPVVHEVRKWCEGLEPQDRCYNGVCLVKPKGQCHDTKFSHTDLGSTAGSLGSCANKVYEEISEGKKFIEWCVVKDRDPADKCWYPIMNGKADCDKVDMDKCDLLTFRTPNKLVTGKECDAPDTYLGKFDTAEACSRAVVKKSIGRYFIYGTSGPKLGKCWVEYTLKSANGCKNYQNDTYDLYEI